MGRQTSPTPYSPFMLNTSVWINTSPHSFIHAHPGPNSQETPTKKHHQRLPEPRENTKKQRRERQKGLGWAGGQHRHTHSVKGLALWRLSKWPESDMPEPRRWSRGGHTCNAERPPLASQPCTPQLNNQLRLVRSCHCSPHNKVIDVEGFEMAGR